MDCPACEQVNLPDDAKFCSNCGFEMKNAHKTKEKEKTENKIYSRVQPLNYLVILNILTFNAYSGWWYFRKTVQLRETGMNINPFLRTVGLYLPILSIYCSYIMYRDAKKLVEINGIQSSYRSSIYPTAVYGALALIYSYCFFVSTGVIGTAIGLIALAGMTYLMTFVQANLNAYWSKIEPDLPIRSLNKLEQCVAIIGGLLLLVVLLQILRGMISYLMR